MDSIPPEDLVVRTAHKMGGQHVCIDAEIVVTHIPSGIEVRVNIGRSQHRNRQVAIDAILGAITSPHYR